MSNAERISRHSRDHKAERPSHGRSRFRLLESAVSFTPRRSQVNHRPTRRFNAAQAAPGIDSAANPIFQGDLPRCARGLSGGSCHPENYSSVSNRARAIARNESQ